jgi:hypothetical protein
VGLQRLLTLYAVGSLAGALTVGAYWGLSKVAQGGLSFLAADITMQTFYAPMVWGGLWAFLYIIPLNISWFWKGIIFSLMPAFTALSLKSGGFDALDEFLTFHAVTRHDVLLVLVIYLVCWGLVTGWMTRDGAAA